MQTATRVLVSAAVILLAQWGPPEVGQGFAVAESAAAAPHITQTRALETEPSANTPHADCGESPDSLCNGEAATPEDAQLEGELNSPDVASLSAGSAFLQGGQEHTQETVVSGSVTVPSGVAGEALAGGNSREDVRHESSADAGASAPALLQTLSTKSVGGLKRSMKRLSSKIPGRRNSGSYDVSEVSTGPDAGGKKKGGGIKNKIVGLFKKPSGRKRKGSADISSDAGDAAAAAGSGNGESQTASDAESRGRKGLGRRSGLRRRGSSGSYTVQEGAEDNKGKGGVKGKLKNMFGGIGKRRNRKGAHDITEGTEDDAGGADGSDNTKPRKSKSGGGLKSKLASMGGIFGRKGKRRRSGSFDVNAEQAQGSEAAAVGSAGATGEGASEDDDKRRPKKAGGIKSKLAALGGKLGRKGRKGSTGSDNANAESGEGSSEAGGGGDGENKKRGSKSKGGLKGKLAGVFSRGGKNRKSGTYSVNNVGDQESEASTEDSAGESGDAEGSDRDSRGSKKGGLKNKLGGLFGRRRREKGRISQGADAAEAAADTDAGGADEDQDSGTDGKKKKKGLFGKFGRGKGKGGEKSSKPKEARRGVFGRKKGKGNKGVPPAGLLLQPVVKAGAGAELTQTRLIIGYSPDGMPESRPDRPAGCMPVQMVPGIDTTGVNIPYEGAGCKFRRQLNPPTHY